VQVNKRSLLSSTDECRETNATGFYVAPKYISGLLLNSELHPNQRRI